MFASVKVMMWKGKEAEGGIGCSDLVVFVVVVDLSLLHLSFAIFEVHVRQRGRRDHARNARFLLYALLVDNKINMKPIDRCDMWICCARA